MKTLIVATPRTGSHALTSTYPNPLYECFNIEDLVIPRFKRNGKMNYDLLSKWFLEALENVTGFNPVESSANNWLEVYRHRPSIPPDHFIKGYDDNMQSIELYEYPTQEQFLNEHKRRWDIISAMPEWTVKIIRYQSVPTTIINDIKEQADNVIRLQRKNKLEQAISWVKSQGEVQAYHTASGDAGQIDYDVFEMACQTIKMEDYIIETQFPDVEPTYYEDLNLSTSNWNKNIVTLNYNEAKCKEILDKCLKT